MLRYSFFHLLLAAWMGLAIVTFFLLLKITAPYGRHFSRSWGPTLPHRLGWIIMESTSPLVFAFFFLTGGQHKTLVAWLFLAAWLGHYGHRSVLYPFRARMKGKRMPVLIMVSAMAFNTINGYLNGHYLGALAPVYPLSWLGDPRFIVGGVLFVTGFAINVHADEVLRRLRKPGEQGYKIPEGGLYRYISCPNYFGEVVEWTGFACMTWSLPALSFALWTVANLLPRARAHHRWYRTTFPTYPPDRKAMLPFLW